MNADELKNIARRAMDLAVAEQEIPEGESLAMRVEACDGLAEEYEKRANELKTEEEG